MPNNFYGCIASTAIKFVSYLSSTFLGRNFLSSALYYISVYLILAVFLCIRFVGKIDRIHQEHLYLPLLSLHHAAVFSHEPLVRCFYFKGDRTSSNTNTFCELNTSPLAEARSFTTTAIIHPLLMQTRSPL